VFSSHEGIQSAVRPASLGTWQTPMSLGMPTSEASDVSLEVDAAGDAAAVWVSSDFTVEASLRPASTGQWQAPVAVSASGEHAAEPQATVRDGGELAAVWSVYEPETVPCSPPHEVPCQLILKNLESAKAAIHPAGGTWQTPTTLARADSVGEVRVALDGSGNATALWRTSSGSQRTIESSQRSAGGDWLAPTTLSATSLPFIGNGLDSSLQLVVDARGDATAGWVHEYVSANGSLSGATAVETVDRVAGGTWRTPSVISGSQPHAGILRMAENSSGETVATWGCSLPPHYPITARAVIRPVALGSWRPPADISATEGGFPEVAIGPDGEAIATWSESGPFTSSAPPPGVYAARYEANRATPGVPQLNGCPGSASSVPPRPVLSDVRMMHRRFHVTRGSTATDATSAAGTAFLFDLSTAAGVRVALDRLASGTRSGRRCLAPERAPRRAHAKGCRRTVSVATLTRRSKPAGHDRIHFTGRIGRRTLRPGAYEARLVATNATGSSSSVAARFEVAPR
jgi:hypothetical protein